jgi:hypothetical protein
MTEIVINNVPSLCAFIRKYNPTNKQVNEIIWKMGIRAIILDESDSETYCKQITEYWDRWSKIRESHFLLDLIYRA